VGVKLIVGSEQRDEGKQLLPVRRKRHWRPLQLAAVGLAVLACARPPAPAPVESPTVTDGTASESSEGTLSVAPVSQTSGPLIEVSLANLSKTLHPYPDSAAYTQSWDDVATLIWGGSGGGLLAFDWNNFTYLPAMATDLPSISADGRTYTFTLRDDLHWSDGTPVTVDDFTFAYENASKKENDFVGLDQIEQIESYAAPDAHTIQVTLKDVKPLDLGYGITSIIAPVPKHVWADKPWNDPTANPEILTPSVVLGPFSVQQYKIDEGATFTPVDTFFLGKPKVPQYQILPSAQPTVAYESLLSGRANWAPNITPDQYEQAKAQPNLTVYEWEAANAPYRDVEFNLTRPFLSDHRVREALARALNRDDIRDVAEQGLASPAYSLIAQANTKWLNPDVERFDYNLDQSRSLLAEAGYTLQNGNLIGSDGQPVKLSVYFPTSSAPRAKIATYMQQQYRDLGITLDVRGLDFNAYTDLVQKQKDYDLALGTWGGGAIDPDENGKAQFITGGQQNMTGYSNPLVDQLYKQGSNELDETRRKQIYDEVQSQVVQDLPVYFIYSPTSFSPATRQVQGIVPTRSDGLTSGNAVLNWSVAR
jgi:peptide/nickel transport system substrate-binding protein